jgi:hypothetical protein
MTVQIQPGARARIGPSGLAFLQEPLGIGQIAALLFTPAGVALATRS